MKQTNCDQRTQWKQWMAGITATLAVVSAGTVYGWITTTMSRMVLVDSPIVISSDQRSWIISITDIGNTIGPIIAAVCADTVGRKKMLLLTSIFYITGWLIVIFATRVEEFYISSIIFGVGIAISYTISPMYISEIADVNIRGALCTVVAVNSFTGSVFACSVGPFVDMKTLPLILLMFPIILILTFVWFPESPYFLVAKGKYIEATESLAFFKGIANIEEARNELEVVILNVKQNSIGGTWASRTRNMLLPNNLKALGIVIFLIITQLMSGSSIVVVYMKDLIERARIGINTDLATIIMLLVGLVSCAMSTLAIERIGRRPLLMASLIATGFNLTILASYLFAGKNGIDTEPMNWLPVVVIILFQFTNYIGLGAVPNALVGEIFPTDVKSISIAITTMARGITGVAVVKFYQIVSDAIDEYVMYYVFAGSCFLSFLFTLSFIPETKNKEFSQIQEELAEIRFPCSKKQDES